MRSIFENIFSLSLGTFLGKLVIFDVLAQSLAMWGSNAMVEIEKTFKLQLSQPGTLAHTDTAR